MKITDLPNDILHMVKQNILYIKLKKNINAKLNIAFDEVLNEVHWDVNIPGGINQNYHCPTTIHQCLFDRFRRRNRPLCIYDIIEVIEDEIEEID